MKRCLLIVVILFNVLLIPQLKGQEVSTAVVKVGPKFGINVSKLSGTQSFESVSMKAGVNAGAFINIRWGQRHLNSPFGTGYFGVQPEFILSSQGARVDGKSLKLNYAIIPIMFKFYLTEDFNVEAGPQFAILMSTPGTINNTLFTYNLSDLRGGKDMGFVLGCGYDFDSGLGVDLRYNMGLIKLANNLPWKNNVLQISFSWLLTL